jgi:hypothetical protein
MVVDHLRRAAALGIALAFLAACGGSPQPGVTYPRYQFTCCTTADIYQVWHPGQAVRLHWIVQPASSTGDTTRHPLVLIAVLMGPYSDVPTLKKGGPTTYAVQGPVVRTDDRTPAPAPITEFILPADLPEGFYNLEIKVDSGGGNYMAASSVVQVGPG